MALAWTKNPLGKWGSASKGPAPEHVEYFQVRSEATGSHRLEHRVPGAPGLLVVTDEPVEDGGRGTAPNPMECMIAAVVGCDWEQACLVLSEHSPRGGHADRKGLVYRSRGEFLVNLDGYVGARELAGAEGIPWVSLRAAWAPGSVGGEAAAVLQAKVVARCPMHRLLADAGCHVDVQYQSGDMFPGQRVPPAGAAKGAAVREKMGVLGAGGPQYHLQAVRADHDGAADRRPGQGFVVAEPEEDGGSGAGANPMHHLMAALTGCLHEQSIVVAEELGVEGWAHVVWSTSFDVNLDGYLGIAEKRHGVKKLPASAVFQRVSVDAEFSNTYATQEQIDAVKALTLKRCPIAGVFRAAGIHVLGVWSKKPA